MHHVHILAGMEVATTEEAPLLKVRDVAHLLNVSVAQVWRWVWSGELRAVRISPKVVRIRRADYDAWVGSKQDASR